MSLQFLKAPHKRRAKRPLGLAGDSRDVVLVTTDLGQVLATTSEQTVLDLGRADPRAEDVDAREVTDALWAECDQAVLAHIAGRQRMQATLKRLRAGR